MPWIPNSLRHQSSLSSTTSSLRVENSWPGFPHFHPDFLPVIYRLQSRLIPLKSSYSGEIPSQFPLNLLAYYLLTSSQLDELAREFHQIWPPVEHTSWYPTQIAPWIGTPQEATVDLETKRRRFGRFIGLRGCESPVDATFSGDVRFEFQTGESAELRNGKPF